MGYVCLATCCKENDTNDCLSERWTCGARLATVDIPLGSWYSTHAPADLRLPRLRQVFTQEPPSHTHGNRPHHRRHITHLIPHKHPQAPLLANRPPRPKPRNSRNRRLSPLLRRPELPPPPNRHRQALPCNKRSAKLRRYCPRSSIHRPTAAPPNIQNRRHHPRPLAYTWLPQASTFLHQQDNRPLAHTPPPPSPHYLNRRYPNSRPSHHHPRPQRPRHYLPAQRGTVRAS